MTDLPQIHKGDLLVVVELGDDRVQQRYIVSSVEPGEAPGEMSLEVIGDPMDPPTGKDER